MNQLLETEILSHVGGIESNNLMNILNVQDNNEDEEVVMFHHSPYYQDRLIEVLKANESKFTIIRTNIESINSKFSELEAFVEELYSNNIKISAICLQECWITDNTDFSLFQLKGYNCIKKRSNMW